jgi:hypothetical protein
MVYNWAVVTLVAVARVMSIKNCGILRGTNTLNK